MDGKTRKLIAVSLFSGCGGLDLGLHQAGYKILWANDFDIDACQTYEKNLGEIVCDDINSIEIPKFPNLDLLVSGFPCQPFSSAGSRKGTSDQRGKFYQTTLDAVRNLNPKAVMIENVRGFLSIKNGKTRLIDYIERELNNMGYHVRYHLMNFSHFGVPQLRIRLVIIAIKDKRYLNSIFPQVIKGKDLTLRNTLKGINLKIPNQTEIMRLNPQALELGKHVPPGGSWKDIPTRFLPERLKRIRKNMKDYGSPVIYRRCSLDMIMSTVTAAFKPENAAVWHPTKSRIFTVREIARIQGFPDDFVFAGRTIKSKYSQIGNAVPPPIGKLFGETLKPYLFKTSPSKSRQKTSLSIENFNVNKPLDISM